MERPKMLVIFYSINLALLIASLIVIQWKNFYKVVLIIFLIMTSFKLVALIISIFILLRKCYCNVEITSICFGILSLLVDSSVNITEIICFFSICR